MKSLPPHVLAYKRTPEFDESTLPDGLRHNHSTKAAVWAKIVVLEGALQYTIDEPEAETVVLDASRCGIVEPTMPHAVKPLGKVRFYVEFYR